MRKIIIILLFLFIAYPAKFIAGDFKVLINYLEGEHSKDSWTKETLITIDEKVYSYSLKTSGHLKVKDFDTNGVFTNEQFNKIKSQLLDKNLLVTDSLFDENEKYKAFERFTNIAITFYIDTSVYKIRINGDEQNFNDKQLYTNSKGFIDLITGFIRKD